MRKILLIIAIILLGAASYFYFRSRETGVPIETSFKSLFPIGNEGVGQFETVPENSGETVDVLPPTPNSPTNQSVATSTNISRAPIAGFYIKTITPKDKPSYDVVRYVRRDTGLVYEKTPDGGALQITNIKIPNIYEAFFVQDGEGVLLRYLKNDARTIGTYYIPIPPAVTVGSRVQAPGKALTDNILSLVVFADGKKIATLRDEKGESVIRISEPDGTKPQIYFSYPFKDWILLADKQDLYLQTKAAVNYPGNLFLLKKNSYGKVLNGLLGLTSAVTPQGGFTLGSTSTNTTTGIILNNKTGVQRTLTEPLLPEKCAWDEPFTAYCGIPSIAPAGLPDSWYRGEVQLVDRLAKVGLDTGIAETKEITGSYDITNPFYSPLTKTFYFIDKTSGLLISLPVMF